MINRMIDHIFYAIELVDCSILYNLYFSLFTLLKLLFIGRLFTQIKMMFI